MENLRRKEVEVIVEGQQPNPTQLVNILIASQEFASKKYGLGAMAVYKFQRQYGK